VGQGARRAMIFDKDDAPRNAGGLTQEFHRLRTMMKDIHKHHGIHRFVRHGQVSSVKRLNGDQRVGALEHVKATDFYPRPKPHHAGRQRPVPGADVQDPGAFGEQRS
jgi:hypothetical protein